MTKILLVDDDEITLNSIYELLSEFGYDVITAHDGLEGFQKYSENRFDLIITDIVMPNMNGITLIEKIRDDLNQKYVPAIAISTNLCLPELSLFDAFYRKTLAVEKLLDTIEMATKNERTWP